MKKINKKRNKKEKIQCVYKLYFVQEPDRVYIGSTDNFIHRITCHYRDLLNNTHNNILLQKSFTTFNVCNFRYEIIEQFDNISKTSLLKIENKYIEMFKSNINGYNIAASTSSRTKNGIENVLVKDLNTSEMEKYIQEFIKNYNIYIKEMKNGTFAGEKNTYTYWWYSKISDEKMKQLCIHASSYVRNYIKESRKTVATILEHKNLPNVRTVLNDKTKQTEFVRRSTKRLLEGNNNEIYINHIILLSALNPYQLDSLLIKTEKELMTYKFFNLIRHLCNLNLNKDFTIHMPTSLYVSYESYIKEIKDNKNEQCNNLCKNSLTNSENNKNNGDIIG